MSWTEYLPQLRILAKRRFGNWNAWFFDTPQEAYGGRILVEAINRLLEAHPEYDFDLTTLTASDKFVDQDCCEFTVALRSHAPCSDCKGSGQYIGLLKVEACQACGGSGRKHTPTERERNQ